MGFREVVGGLVSPTPFTESCDKAHTKSDNIHPCFTKRTNIWTEDLSAHDWVNTYVEDPEDNNWIPSNKRAPKQEERAFL